MLSSGELWAANFCLGLEARDADWLRRFLLAVLLQQASCFERKVVQPLEKFPFKLLLLAKAADDEVCSTRQKVAAEILGTQTHMLEINARKMKSTFESDLTVAMNQGLLVGHLRVSIRGLAQRWQADTRESERINKTCLLYTSPSPRDA